MFHKLTQNVTQPAVLVLDFTTIPAVLCKVAPQLLWVRYDNSESFIKQEQVSTMLVKDGTIYINLW